MLIELIQPHEHAGRVLPVGTRFELDDVSAGWLIARGAAIAVAPEVRVKPLPSLKGKLHV